MHVVPSRSSLLENGQDKDPLALEAPKKGLQNKIYHIEELKKDESRNAWQFRNTHIERELKENKSKNMYNFS